MANEKLRYSDQELEEFRAIIDEKLKVAKQTYHDCMAQLNHSDSNDVVDTSPTYKALEEGSSAPAEVYQGIGGCVDSHPEQDLWY